MALSKIANSSIETSDAFVFTANSTLDGVHTGVTGNNLKVTANSTLSGAASTISSANTNLFGAYNTVSGANTVFKGHVLFDGTSTVKVTGTQIGFSDPNALTASGRNVFTKSQTFKTTNIANAGGDGFGGQTLTLNLANSNFYEISLANNVTIANPTNIANTQAGAIFLNQDSTGGRTVTFGSFWRFPGGSAPSLSIAGNSQDRIDYIVKSANTIHASATLNLLGTA